MTLKVTQADRNCCYSTNYLMLCNNNVSTCTVYDITTFTVHVTACDLEKSFCFDKTVEITSFVRFQTRV